MKRFIIDKDFGQELVNEFIQFTNENDCGIEIYLDSNGGEFPTAQIIADIINYDPDRFVIIAVNAIRSSAFYLFFAVKCDKRILDDTTGLHHLMGRTARVMSNGVHSDEVERFEFKRLKECMAKEIAFCQKIGFTEKELNAFKAGKDVFFTTERLIELINNTK